MADELKLHDPWLVAAWPGMGNVALNAGIYLLSKLDMSLIAELDTGDLFDVNHVDVQAGIVKMGRRPRNRFFAWIDPEKQRDLVVFLGEAQPPLGRLPFCREVVSLGRQLGVRQVVTFAAMATQMHPEHPSRVFGAATDDESLVKLKKLELEVLEDGQIGGLNGVLLGAAAESGLQGMCLLGEMPHIFSQLPFPKASLAILRAFTTLTGMQLDFTELAEQAQTTEEQLGELLAKVEQAYGQQAAANEDDEFGQAAAAAEEERLKAEEQEHVDRLFLQAEKDRSKAFELKQELDRLGKFKDYEDRFLDLFKKPD